jgi:hypothetical protein
MFRGPPLTLFLSIQEASVAEYGKMSDRNSVKAAVFHETARFHYEALSLQLVDCSVARIN